MLKVKIACHKDNVNFSQKAKFGGEKQSGCRHFSYSVYSRVLSTKYSPSAKRSAQQTERHRWDRMNDGV